MSTWKDISAVTGDNFDLSLGEALASWKQRGFLKDLLQRAAVDKYLREVARRANVAVSVEELQAGADHYRSVRGLHSAERTQAWLRQHGLTVNDLQAAVERDLIANKLRARVAEKSVQAYYAEAKDLFARVRLRRLTVASESAAQELLFQLTEEGADFADLARTVSLDATERNMGGDLGVLQRRMLPANLAAPIFAATPGKIVGPLTTERGVHLFLVEQLFPPELDAATARIIRERVFQSWLGHQLNTLRLCWPLLDEL